MAQIVIEVNDATAKKWRDIPQKIKTGLQESFARQIESFLQKTNNPDFEKLLQQARDEAGANGLSEERLQQLLNED